MRARHDGSPLWIATRSNSEDLFRYLISEGANIDHLFKVQGVSGTVLEQAAANAKLRWMKICFEHGANGVGSHSGVSSGTGAR